MALKIVTDSTCDLPKSLVQQGEITVVPLMVRFGQETYLDGVDLSADEFFRKLTKGPVLPTTAAPAPGAFSQVYRELVGKGHQVLSIHVSSKLSATYSSAELGKKDVRDSGRIEVLDSLLVTAGLGLLVLQAARAARDGGKLADVLAMVKGLIPRVKLYGAFDTLEYLRKGGRVGAARAFLGGVLNLKPLIVIREGEVHPLERVRTRAKAVNRLFELVREARGIEELAVIHSTTPDERDELAKRLAPLAPGKEIVRAQFGPVLGTYTGPGVMAVTFIEKQ